VSRQASINGSDIRFSVREIAALELLMRREGRVISKVGLEEALYGPHTNVSPNAIEVLISRVRRRLEAADAGCSIHTLYGIGYLLKE
jgi:DNA-binding response OmpR family regulator